MCDPPVQGGTSRCAIMHSQMALTGEYGTSNRGQSPCKYIQVRIHLGVLQIAHQDGLDTFSFWLYDPIQNLEVDSSIIGLTMK